MDFISSLLSVPGMKPLATGKVEGAAGVYAMKSYINNVYVLPAEDGYIAIDAGNDVRSLALAFAKCGIDPSKVRHLFLTHADGDHVNGLGLFPGAALYISRQEFTPQSLASGKLVTTRGGRLPGGIGAQRFTFLNGGERYDGGGHVVECIPAPGHTPGSMAYLVDDKYLFTGDTFKLQNNALSVHPFSADDAQSRQTIERLRALLLDRSPPRIAFTAHFGIYRGNRAPG